MLHLKTGLAYLEDNVLLVAGEFIENPTFADYKKIVILLGSSENIFILRYFFGIAVTEHETQVFTGKIREQIN